MSNIKMSENQVLEPRIFEDLERVKGFEPSTPTLARLCSTTELHPRRISLLGGMHSSRSAGRWYNPSVNGLQEPNGLSQKGCGVFLNAYLLEEMVELWTCLNKRRSGFV